MERTKRFFPPDDTPKPLKRQGFSDSRFQNDLPFSNQPRYDHFDTAAQLIQDTRHVQKNQVISLIFFTRQGTSRKHAPASRT